MKKSFALAFACLFLFVGCSSMCHHSVKWEYQKVNDFAQVQKLGAEGWSLVGFHSFDSGSQGTYYILKRRLR